MAVWNNPVKEWIMQWAFRLQVAAALRDPRRFDHPGPGHIGYEREGIVHAPNGSRWKAGRICKLVIADELADHELGAHQFEVRTERLDLSGATAAGLVAALQECWTDVERAVRERGGSVILSGFDPFRPVPGARYSTAKAHYAPAMEYYRQSMAAASFTSGTGLDIPIRNPAIPGHMCASHPNVQASSLAQGVEWMNDSLDFAWILAALGGSSRYIMGPDGKIIDSQWNDCRMHLWELLFDGRVGLPEEYFPDAAAYFRRMLRFSFLRFAPSKAMATATGMSWLAARLKLVGDRAVVEMRAVPTQPRAEDEVALSLLWLGWLHRDRAAIPRLPFHMAEANYLNAQQRGLQGAYWVERRGYQAKLEGSQAVSFCVEEALQGLKGLGISGGVALAANLVRERLKFGSPSDQLALRLQHQPLVDPIDMERAMRSLGMLA